MKDIGRKEDCERKRVREKGRERERESLKIEQSQASGNKKCQT